MASVDNRYVLIIGSLRYSHAKNLCFSASIFKKNRLVKMKYGLNKSEKRRKEK